MKRAIALAVLVACGSHDAPAPPPAPAPVDPHELVVLNCLSCHAEDMLAQQRLTSAQWAKTVKKMTAWGALIEPADTDAVVAYLASHYGSGAGAYTNPTISTTAALAQLAPQPDGAAFGSGDAARGKDVFTARCAACHGLDAQGGIGVNLVDRPILYRAQELAEIVRAGKGRMLPFSGTDRELADVVAYLRQLR